MINAVAAADRRVADVDNQTMHESAIKLQTPRETKSWFQLIFVCLDSVVNTVNSFCLLCYVLVSQTENECEIVADLPIIFTVEVCFSIAILQKEWTKTLLEIRRATVDQLIEPVAIVDAVTSGDSAAVEAAGEV